ncbi:acyl carrier protein [Micromonospora sp. CPCC 205539]|uniref:acyl carrier protein n=1 Tax=Micromonospora sp. CPCC 205539 TaxID=3122408 RepID=UPI002FF2E97D
MDTAHTPAGGVAGDLVGAIADMLDREPASISRETRFFDDLGFDSTSILVLLTQIETRLSFEFDPDELEPQDLETVGSLISFVERQAVS